MLLRFRFYSLRLIAAVDRAPRYDDSVSRGKLSDYKIACMGALMAS